MISLIILLVIVAAWIFVGWAVGRIFNIRWRALKRLEEMKREAER